MRRSYVIRSHGKSPWRIFSWDSICLIIVTVSMRLYGNTLLSAKFVNYKRPFAEYDVRYYLNGRICFVFSGRKRGNLRGHRLHRP